MLLVSMTPWIALGYATRFHRRLAVQSASLRKAQREECQMKIKYPTIELFVIDNYSTGYKHNEQEGVK